MEENKKRNYGIDLLRIVSMFMVVMLHILGQGGILEVTESKEAKFAMSWFLEIIAYSAVNCYALITGFVCFSEKDKLPKFSKYMMMWLQVEFYSVLIAILFWKFGGGIIGVKQVIKSFLPVATNQYWYFTAYTGVFFIIPWLNKIVQTLKKENLKLYIVILVLFTFYVTGANLTFSIDAFGLREGYSFLWLAILYVIGAYIKKYELHYKKSKKRALKVIMGLVMFTWCWKIGIGKLTMHVLGRKTATNLFVSYMSPTIVGIAIALLFMFANLNIKSFSQKIIQWMSPAVFGVYLLHMQPLVFDYILKNRYCDIGDLPVYLIPVAVLGNALLIFTLGVILDKIRIVMFHFLKLDKISEKIEKWIMNIRYKLCPTKKESSKCTTPTS